MKKLNPMRLLLNLDIAVASVAMCALVGFTFTGIFARYIVGKPYGWIEEVQSALVVWVIFGAAGAAFRTASHASIEIFFDEMPKWLQRLVGLMICVVTVGTLAYLGMTSMDYIKVFSATGRDTPVLNISYVLIYSVVPVSCAWQIINYLLVNFTKYSELETIDDSSKSAKEGAEEK